MSAVSGNHETTGKPSKSMASLVADLATAAYPRESNIEWASLAALITGALLAVLLLLIGRVAVKHLCLQYIGPCTGISVEDQLLQGGERSDGRRPDGKKVSHARKSPPKKGRR